MSWNHRVLRHHQDGGDFEDFLQIHEVHYDGLGAPRAFTENGIAAGGDTVEEVREVLGLMLACLDKPILDAEAFPAEWVQHG